MFKSCDFSLYKQQCGAHSLSSSCELSLELTMYHSSQYYNNCLSCWVGYETWELNIVTWLLDRGPSNWMERYRVGTLYQIGPSLVSYCDLVKTESFTLFIINNLEILCVVLPTALYLPELSLLAHSNSGPRFLN